MDERQDDENLVEYILFQQVDLRRRPNSQVAGINVDVVFAATNCWHVGEYSPMRSPAPVRSTGSGRDAPQRPPDDR